LASVAVLDQRRRDFFRWPCEQFTPHRDVNTLMRIRRHGGFQEVARLLDKPRVARDAACSGSETKGSAKKMHPSISPPIA